ncbi:DgyrCDS12210 [Dimorphilus gyrociliatus]|uniref:Acyl-coenzyme A oxidase n=1 Tax=Dimorphilus gyrociliatus TaxID=2664684 RepID=A0A7I8W7K5_9ANNE|nr:DgyrCDS12210 [Dimorphilus gyrociliatus]
MTKPTINPDLEVERRNASFNVSKMTEFLHGGVQQLKRVKQIKKQLLGEKIFGITSNGKSAEEIYDLSVKKNVILFELVAKYNWNIDDLTIAHELLTTGLPLSLQIMMFIPTLERLCTDEQKQKWLPLAKSYKLLGTYAQTELGHGTNIRDLKTRADFDQENNQFVLNNPFPDGIKWWPGGLGKTMNCAIVLASLYVDNQYKGLEAFLVPIRDMETHEPLLGVQVGDIGPKMGLLGSDNGYLILKNVRIPRTNMLMKYSEVDRNGRYIQHGDPKANYGAMTLLRSGFVRISALGLQAAATISGRYSCVRRQGHLDSKGEEVKVMDYVTQQYKITGNIVNAYALTLISMSTADYYHKVFQEISVDNWTNLLELHTITCGLKAFCSEISSDGIEVSRRACGGHGYLASSGLSNLYVDHLPVVTVEGENTILYLQVARYILKKVSSFALKGEGLPPSLQYVSEPTNGPISIETLTGLCKILQIRSSFQAKRVAEKFQNLLMSGENQGIAWNKCSQELVNAAKAHVECIGADMFMRAFQKSSTIYPDLVPMLEKLLKVYFYQRILEGAIDYVESGAVTIKNLDVIRERHCEYLTSLRKDVIPLVDAFDMEDEQLKSAIGCYDGWAYDRLYNEAQISPLNKLQVQPAFQKYIKPLQIKSKL